MTPDRETRDRVRALVREVLAATTEETADAGERQVTEGRATEQRTTDKRAISESLATSESRVTGKSPVIAESPPITAPLVDVQPAARVLPETAEAEFTRDESAKTIITETDVRDLEAGARLRINQEARLTPLAADIVRERRIELVRRAARHGSSNSRLRTIAIGADHGGFEMKRELDRLLTESGYKVRDFGTHSIDAVDYPDIAHAVARAVADSQADLGIIIDGAGVGSAMTANKVPGIRAAACYSIAVARNSREHNDANVLTLGSKTITNDEMREIVEAWLTMELTEERHRKRVAKIEAIERQYRC